MSIIDQNPVAVEEYKFKELILKLDIFKPTTCFRAENGDWFSMCPDVISVTSQNMESNKSLIEYFVSPNS